MAKVTNISEQKAQDNDLSKLIDINLRLIDTNISMNEILQDILKHTKKIEHNTFKGF